MPINMCAVIRLIPIIICASWIPASEAATAAVSALDHDTARALQEAELRKAIADADRAELQARAPLAVSGLAGTLETRNLGAAGLVKAVDLAQQLASEVCAALPTDQATLIYEASSTQGILAARSVAEGLARYSEELTRQNAVLQAVIDRQRTQDARQRALTTLIPALIPATIKAAVDISALFKTNLTATGTNYGDATRALFASALAQHCADKLSGLGSGYLGELDTIEHDKLLARLRALGILRGAYAHRIALIQGIADTEKGDAKRELTTAINAAGAFLKTVDQFIDALKAGEASDKSPFYNAARYLGYAERTSNSMVLDFDLRLEGLTLVQDKLLSGQQLRLSGVAFLWYRLHAPDGSLRFARTLRKMTAPIAIDLRGTPAPETFWDAR